MARIYVETYGCTLNLADSDLISGELLGAGHELVSSAEYADVVIINTCTVKGPTENKISSRIQRIAKSNRPLIIAGCLVANTKMLRDIAPNAVIVGTGSISFIKDAVKTALLKHPAEFISFEDKNDLSRLFTAPILRIPICEGCVNNCYFCHTKLARPRLRSYRQKTIARWVEEGVAKGAKEIQLTAMDSGVYGMDTKSDLPELMQSINSINGDFLARLGMINPQHVKMLGNSLMDAISLPKFYKFIHVPVQTGSEKVCVEMNRGHTVEDFRSTLQTYRERMPEISMATDIIVGYPTETEDDLEDTIKLIERSGLDAINISKFSARPGTKAKDLNVLKTQEVKRRSRIASEVARRVLEERNKKFIGKTYEVLITEKQKHFTGRNINYKQVVVKKFKGKLGDRIKVEIIDANYGVLFGEHYL
jgi:MiaB-like tRNA modifying enzyme